MNTEIKTKELDESAHLLGCEKGVVCFHIGKCPEVDWSAKEEIKTKEEWELELRELDLCDDDHDIVHDFIADLLSSQKEQFATQLIEALEGEKFPSKEGGSKDLPYTEMLTVSNNTHEAMNQYIYNEGISKAQQIINKLK